MREDVSHRPSNFLRQSGIKYKDAYENVLREIEIMKKLNHANIVKLIEVIDTPDSDKMYISISLYPPHEFPSHGVLRTRPASRMERRGMAFLPNKTEGLHPRKGSQKNIQGPSRRTRIL
jgi:Protein kinase domain.